MAKIWILTKGEYSEYHIIGAFHDEDLVRQIAAKSDSLRVEEYELNAMAYLRGREYLDWRIEFDADGNCLSIYREFPLDDDDDEFDSPSVSGWGSGLFVCGVKAKTEAEAIKIASEHRRKKLAE